ncbi:MAG: hypothetical protein ABL963_02860 [Longimicrobiales bacterium]
MQVTSRRILELLEHPHELEALYREHPESFREGLEEACRDRSDAVALQVWKARLDYQDPVRALDARRAFLAIVIGLVVGGLVRIPLAIFDEDWFFPRFVPSLVLLGPVAYFWSEQRNRLVLMAGLLLALVAAVFVSLVPELSDSVVMALIHLPILFWALLGAAFAGGAWREPHARLRFIRYNGDMIILVTLVALGGFVFSALTMGLFSLAANDPEEWYVMNIGLVGGASIPVVATYLYDVVFARRTGIASVLARVFAPLFLVMSATYLVVAFAGGENPFVDRDFLVVFNGLLLVILGMTVFSIAERGERGDIAWIDYVNVALLMVTLVIDLVALSAISFRLGSYGLTPNRLVVLGANLVVMTHLAWTCRAYVGFLRGRATVAGVQRAVTGYLPVYVGWAAFVVFVLPFLMRFA